MMFYSLAAVGKDLECFVLSKHTTAYTHRENYLNNISSKIKIQCGPATQTVSTSSFSRETNTIIKLERGGGGSGGRDRRLASLEIRSLLRSKEGRHCLMNDRPNYPQSPPPPRLSGADGSFCASPFISPDKSPSTETLVKPLLSDKDGFGH